MTDQEIWLRQSIAALLRQLKIDTAPEPSNEEIAMAMGSGCQPPIFDAAGFEICGPRPWPKA